MDVIRKPLGDATAQVILGVLLLLGASTSRFGKAIAPQPAIAPGKAFLIGNIATLMRHGGQNGHALVRYLQATASEVCRICNAPTGLSGDERRRFLGSLEQRRQSGTAFQDLEAEVQRAIQSGHDNRKIVALAGAIYRWKEELTRGH